MFIEGYYLSKSTPIYIEFIHYARGKIDQLLGFRSDATRYTRSCFAFTQPLL
jgi:hypothetical protein